MMRNSPLRRRVLSPLVMILLLLSVLAPPRPAVAQGAAEGSGLAAALARSWQKTLDDADALIAEPDTRDSRLVGLRDQLANLQVRVRDAADAAARDAAVLRTDLAALGAAPAADQPAEASHIAARRKSLQESLASAEGTVKEAELATAHARRTMEALNGARRMRFTEQILTRGISPLSPSLWRRAGAEFGSGWSALAAEIQPPGSKDGERASNWEIGGHLAVALVLAVLLAFPLRARLIRRFGYAAVEREPSEMQRLWAAAFTGVVRAVLPSLAACAVYFGLLYDEVLSDAMVDGARLVVGALIVVFFTAGFCRSALAPDDPDWRLVRLGDRGARLLSRGITALAVLLALHRLLELWGPPEATVDLIAARKFLFGLAISGVLLAMLRRGVWFADAATPLGPGWQRLRYGLGLFVVAIPLSAAFGYVVLSWFLVVQVLRSLGLWAVVALLHRIVGESVAHALSVDSRLGRRVRAALELNDEGAEMLAFWLGGSLQLAVLALGAMGFLVLWGYGGKELAAGLRSTFFGFRIGQIEISLANLLLALGLFGLLLAATRMLQRSLDQRIFPRTRLDRGLRHSIRSAVGYVGFALAAMLGISTLGLDLSNLAIIAGALSVGIGFGLQNIINNFVSGLILLVERPIKAGDWVVVGEHQGYVRKISVRATEITTFDRASVFIPNSSLISGTVMNRTHADKVGRVVLPVGIDYGCDPKRARDILLEIALAHPEVRRNPPPNALFRSFGDNALNFELYAYLHDVDKVLSVTSDLCFAVHEAFRNQGIGIPFPQREMRVALDEAQLRRVIAGLGGRRGFTGDAGAGESLWGSAARTGGPVD